MFSQVFVCPQAGLLPSREWSASSIGVCIHGGGWGAGGSASREFRQTLPRTTEYGHQAGGTHPTGMHSCLEFIHIKYLLVKRQIAATPINIPPYPSLRPPKSVILTSEIEDICNTEGMASFTVRPPQHKSVKQFFAYNSILQHLAWIMCKERSVPFLCSTSHTYP